MCGRYVIEDIQDLSERFRAKPLVPWTRPMFNAAPTQQLPVVVPVADGRELRAMRWGLIPRWSKDPAREKLNLFNARAETVAEKPAFRHLIRGHRCLVPANGFYEWERRDGRKQPHFFTVADTPLFALAGLYDERSDEDGEIQGSYTVLTTRPNELVAPYHDRMPVILRPDDEDAWLDPDLDEPAALERFYEPFRADLMRERAVSDRVNNTRNDDPALLESPA